MSAVDLRSLSKPEFMAHWFQRVWTEGDASAIEQMMSADSIIRGVGNAESVGPDGFKAFQQSLLQQITNIRFTILRTLEDDEWLSALWKMEAQRRDTGEPVETTGTVFVQIKDGKFASGYNHFDTIGLYQDLGMMPRDTVPRMLQSQMLS